MRTNIYIDGYNLYYGLLKHTEYKWLDLYKLFECVLKIQSPQSSINKIKYFTADVKSKVSSHGQAAQQAQNNYNRALEQLYPGQIEIIKGYSLDYANLPKYQKPPDKTQRAEVWRLEEKQTDVNIALHMYRDVMRGDCDHVILVSNDTDLEPAFEAIRQDDESSVKIGVIIPIKKHVAGKAQRPINQRLSQYADWTRHHILDDELFMSQLPGKIPTKKKAILKPDYW